MDLHSPELELARARLHAWDEAVRSMMDAAASAPDRNRLALEPALQEIRDRVEAVRTKVEKFARHIDRDGSELESAFAELPAAWSVILRRAQRRRLSHMS